MQLRFPMTRPILLIRANRNEEDSQALSKLGFESVIDPYLTIRSSASSSDAKLMLGALNRASADDNLPTWFVLTSANGIKYFQELVGKDALVEAMSNPNLRFAAIGAVTKKALFELGVTDALMPSSSDSSALAEALISTGPGIAIWPRSAIAMKNFPNRLSEAGWSLVDGVVYETNTIEVEPASAKKAMAGDFSAIVVLSPSAARALATYVNPMFSNLSNTDIVCMGETTAVALRELGFKVARTATTVKGAFA
jgi:uroporphyrinogen-III synthase